MDDKVFNMTSLYPIAKELTRHMETSEATLFLDRVNKYYSSDVRSLTGLIIGNLRLLISEVLRLRKTNKELRRKNDYLRQCELFPKLYGREEASTSTLEKSLPVRTYRLNKEKL